MLKNAYLVAKIGANTAENEPKFGKIIPGLASVLVSKLEPRAVLALLGWIAAGTAVFARAVCYDSRALMANLIGLVLGCIEAKVCK